MTVMHPSARWSQEKAVEAVIPDWQVKDGDDIRVIASTGPTGEFQIRVKVSRTYDIDRPVNKRPRVGAERTVTGAEAVEVFNHLIGWDDPCGS